MNNKTKDCIKCNLCKKHCEFLNKYDMDLDVFSKREDLAYNCFLCGRCKEVCPKDIDGKTIALDMSQAKIKNQFYFLDVNLYRSFLKQEKS